MYTIAMASDGELPQMRQLAGDDRHAGVPRVALGVRDAYRARSPRRTPTSTSSRRASRNGIAWRSCWPMPSSGWREVPELKLRIADLEHELADARRPPTPPGGRRASWTRCSCTGEGCCGTSDRSSSRCATPTAAAQLTVPRSALDGRRQGRFANLPRRIYLTYKYRGISSVLFRSLIFPLRLTPLDRVLRLGPGPGSAPSPRGAGTAATGAGDDRDPQLPRREAGGAARHEDPTDDRPRSGADHRHRRRQRARPRRRAAPDRRDRGTAAATTTAASRSTSTAACAPPTRATTWCCSTPTLFRCATGWRACSTRPARPQDRRSSAPSCSTPTTASSTRERSATRPRRSGSTTATASSPPTGARRTSPARRLPPPAPRMYITRAVLDQVGLFDEQLRMGYEDVDYCLRAWEAGYQVLYAPAARLHHHESVRGHRVGERERKSQRMFWERWGTFFGERP